MPIVAAALTWIVVVAVVSAVSLVLIIVAPWRTVRREPPLADEIESRLLLGEDPDAIDRDLAARESGRASVTDLHDSPEAEGAPQPETDAEAEADHPG